MEEFLREIQEDMEREKYRQLWKRYGKAMIALAAFAIAVSVGLQGFKAYTSTQHAKATDALLAKEWDKAASYGGDMKAIALLNKGDAAGAAEAAKDAGLKELAALRAGEPVKDPKALQAASLEMQGYQALEKSDVARAKALFGAALADENIPASARNRLEAAVKLLEAHPDLIKE